MKKEKRRLLSILLSLAMMLGMLSGMSLTAAAQATSINITFKSSGSSSDGTSARDSIDYIIESGAAYVSSLSASKVFNGKDGCGIKLGSSSQAGSLTLNLSNPMTVSAITVEAKRYSVSDSCGLKIQDKTYDDVGSDFETFTYTYAQPTEISSVALSSTGKRIYIKSVTLIGQAASDHTHNDVTFTEWTDAVAKTQYGAGATAATSLPSVEGSYYLTADVTISGTWSVPGTTNLCLNGHSITRTGNGSVISIPTDSTLNLYDEEGDAGTITGGNTSKGGGVMINGGTLNMYGGKISGNKATSYGGGVCIDESGEFVMDGGTISDNDSSNNGFGGGVCAYNGTFILKSGLISGNKAKIGGGVQVYYNSDTQFTMSGGAIQGNSALGQYYSARGGGIDIMRPFTMSGGKISGNYTDGQGGAMYVQNDIVINGGEIYGNSAAAGSGGIYNSNYNISISGNVLIKDNNVGGTLDGDIYTGGTVSNVYFSGTSRRFNITGALAQTASIGLTMKTPGVFTSSAEGINAIDYKDNFVSDDPELFIAKQEDGDELQLFRQPVSYLDENGEEQQCNVYTPVDKNTASWSNGWYFVNDSITINSYPASVSGTVNLILGDGATLTAEKGIRVVGSYTLNIFVQSHGTSTGKLISTGADGQAGIGSAAPGYSSSNPSAGGTVNIYGGDITAIGGKGAAGIGGGARYNSSKQGCPGGTVNIYGGTVTATAGAADDAKGSAVAIGAGGSAEDHGTLTLGEGVKLETSTDGEIWTEATDTTTRTQYMKTSYTEPVATYDVSITAGEGMTKTTDSGEASQTGLTDAMTDVVYTANDGYYFPTDYSVDAVNRITVTRDSYTQITVSGTPTADADIVLADATEKEDQSAPETTGFTVTDATSATSADGEISGVTTAMEYSVDGTTWTAVEDTSITGLNPGDVQIRLAGDDTHNASDAVTVSIGDASLITTKTNATEAVNGVDADDYIADDQETVTNAKTTALAAIEVATTEDEVTAALTTFNTAIANCTTKVANVEALIAALPDATEVTTADKDAIEAARAAYNALDDDQKALVDETSLAKLEDAENVLAFEEYKATQTAEAEGKAQEGDSDECAALITGAKDDIADLTYDFSKSLEENKAEVDSVIEDLESALTDQREVDAVIAMIGAIPDGNITAEDATAITDAGTAYDALDEDQKAHVGEANTKKLTDSEAVLSVAEMVDALPEDKDVQDTDVDAIHAARDAYEALSEDQKALMDASVLDDLEACEATLYGTIAEDVADVEEITEDNIEDVENLLASYDKLADDEKDIVDKALGRKGVQKLADLQRALDVVNRIDKIAEAEDADSFRKSVSTARTAYELLTDSQKALVSDEKQEKLEYAELTVEKLSATSTFLNYANENALDDFTDTENEAYGKVVEDGYRAIIGAKDKKEISAAFNEAKSAIRDALARIKQDRVDAAEMAEADEALADAKLDAEDEKEYARSKAADEYVSDADKLAIDDAIAALDEALKAADELPQDATAEEKRAAAEAIDDAADALWDAAYNAYVNAAAARAAEKAAEEAEAAEAAQLAAAKEMALGRLEDYSEAKAKTDTTDAEKAEYDQVVADGKAAIEAAEDKDAVAAALKAAKAAINAELEKIDDDRAAAAAVMEEINDLPAVDEITAEDKGEIKAARAAYEALTDDQKAKISEDTLQKLADAEERLAVVEKYSNEWIDGKWYNKNGTQTYKGIGKWRKTGKGWWYGDSKGWYAKNQWQKIDGKWYFFGKDGYMEANAYRDGYYLKANGAWDGKAKVTGWKQTAKGWTYIAGVKALRNTWKKIDGKWYYFKSTGYIAMNEFVQGWWCDKNGVQNDPVKCSWHKTGRGWWYGVNGGWYAKNATYTIDGKSYTFDKIGYQK